MKIRVNKVCAISMRRMNQLTASNRAVKDSWKFSGNQLTGMAKRIERGEGWGWVSGSGGGNRILSFSEAAISSNGSINQTWRSFNWSWPLRKRSTLSPSCFPFDRSPRIFLLPFASGPSSGWVTVTSRITRNSLDQSCQPATTFGVFKALLAVSINFLTAPWEKGSH